MGPHPTLPVFWIYFEISYLRFSSAIRLATRKAKAPAVNMVGKPWERGKSERSATHKSSEVTGIETAIADVKEVNLEEIASSDAVLIGSPNHVGRPARGIDAFIDKLGKLDLKTKWVAVFDTHMAADERAHIEMEKRIGEKLPGLRLITPGLSIEVKAGLSMKGPIVEGELPKCVDFGKKIATQLKT